MVAQEVRPWRRRAVLGLLALGAIAVLGRAFQLTVVEREFLTRESDKRAQRTVAVPAHRGAIRDRRGEPLALSAPVDSLWAIPSEVLDAPEYVAPLAKLLGQAPAELRGFLRTRRERSFVYLRRHMDPDAAKRVLALKAPGVFAQREYRRYYPAGEVAAQLVGFCDVDGRGQEGLEAAQNAILAGQAGKRRVIRDRSGRVVEEGGDYEPAEPGRDVELSIDLRLQYLAYRELKAAVGEHRALGGLAVVADAQTGEILATASQPGFNPNRPDERGDADAVRNRALADLFEPGSTVKPLLVAQALEQGRFRPDSRIDTHPGYLKLGAFTVKDVHPLPQMNLAELLRHSSNVGAARIGLALGAESVWNGYQKFGFGEPLSLGFPGEARGVFRPHGEWGLIATATASYGYGLSLTALHLVRAYAGLANDGLMPALSLLASGRYTPPQRAVSAEVAQAVRHLMAGVVSEGTGAKARVPGYTVAGKTGTVRKVAAGGGYDEGRHQATFLGIVPAERPRLVGLVMIDQPAAGSYYGGQVAAPVFSAVMQGALRLLQIAPDEMPATQAAAAGVERHT
ncbi:MAG: penicillin-binding protein 2 [Gammaproteobacteria bacterium]|nr:penicillin-binding protein 2 [Gammaproteobacteria bacterium]